MRRGPTWNRATPPPGGHGGTGGAWRGARVIEELDRLWKLRALDEEVAALDQRLARLPEQRQALESSVATARARLEAHASALAAMQKRRRELEREIEGIDAQEKRFLSQQAAVKTNAEYQALTHEITACKVKRSDLETQVLSLMEDEERSSAARPPLERELAAADAERAERTRAIAAEETAARAQRAALEARRERQLEGLNAATRQRYERVRTSRGGRAVVPIVKGACGGCYRAQPPQVLMEAKKRDRLLVCDGCGRILVLPPDAA